MRLRCWACSTGKWPLSGRYCCCVAGIPGSMRGRLYRLRHCVVNCSALPASARGHWAVCCLQIPVCAAVSLNWQRFCRDRPCLRPPPVICGNGLQPSGAGARCSGYPASRYWSVKYFYPIFRLTGRWYPAGEVDEKCDCLFAGDGSSVER